MVLFSVSTLSAQTVSAVPQDLVTINPPPPALPALHEIFEDPKLHDGELKQTVGVMLERSDFPTYSRELWRVQWRQFDPIDLYIIRPQKAIKPAVILYLYSFPSDTDRFQDDSYCKAVTARGIAAVGFVSALTGQRYHDRPWKEWFVSALPEALGSTTHDVQMILDFLASQADLDMQRVGMFGQGSGATVAALAASVDTRIRAVDLLDPWGDWKLWMQQSPVVPDGERANYETDAFQARLANLDPSKVLPTLSTKSVRLQQTDFNADVPPEVRRALAGHTAQGAVFIGYKDEDDYKARAASNGVILDWISSQLMKP